LDVYVDESGDLGFSDQSTKFFVVAYLMCNSSSHIRVSMKRLLKRLHERRKYHRSHSELKFSRMSHDCRRFVLAKIAEYHCSIGIVVVEKIRVRENLRKDLTILYSYLVVHNIISDLLPLLESKTRVRITFDKSLSKRRIDSFNHYIREKASYLFFERGNKYIDCITALCWVT
jgi:hypothetical protein